MTSVATPRKRVQGRRKWWIIGGAILILITLAAILTPLLGRQNASQTNIPGWSTAEATTGTIDASINATGNVEPKASAVLNFQVAGIVTEIAVQPGDTVHAGQALAKVETADLELALESALADLKQAQADQQALYEKATPEDIADAQARVRQAQAQYNQVRGNVTQADIDAARARLAAAKAQLAVLEAGNTDLSDAQDSLAKAQTQYEQQRDSLSLAKTNAQYALDQAVSSLTAAQQSYATAKSNWEFVDSTGKDPTTPNVTDSSGKEVANKLNDTQRQQYYDAYVQAEATLKNAESAVAQAQAAYDQARQAEITGMAAAQQDLKSAESQVGKLQAGGQENQLASARAAVQEAQAALNKLTGTSRSGDLEAAQASVTMAQAALDKLNTDPTASDLSRVEAGVARAEASVKKAQRELELATLTAPYAGTIAHIGYKVGETSSATSTSGGITLADLSSFHIDVPVDELDVAQIQLGQPVTVVLDALPNTDLSGSVTNIEPLATQDDRGTNTYTVQVTLDSQDAAIRPGMTASTQIITLRKEDVVLVPRRAIRTENGKNYVLIPTADSQARLNADGTPASEKREVSIGLSNSEQIEITSGLQAGEQVYVQDVVSTYNPIQ